MSDWRWMLLLNFLTKNKKNIEETNQKLLFIKTIIFANKCHYCFPFQNVSNYLVRELFPEVETKQW